MFALFVLLACDKPREELDPKECVAREDCARAPATDLCTGEIFYGGCYEKHGGCGDIITGGFIYDGQCVNYLGYPCYPDDLEPCVSECDTRYDTATP
jgi:hypothetical protein